MSKMPLPIKVLLLAIKPLSKTADIWDLRDIANIVIQAVGWGGGWLILNNFDWFNPYWLAIFPAILLFIAALKLQRKNDDYESKTPNIVFQEGNVATGAIYRQSQFVPEDQEIDRTQALGLQVYLVYVFVKNDPKGYRGEERTAKKSVAAIDVFQANNIKKASLSFWGHWRDKPQVTTRPRHVSFTDLMEYDLPPNGLPHRIDFATKYHEDEDMYGYNDEIQRYSTDARPPQYKLPSEGFFVRVRIRAIGLNGEVSWWYQVNHSGKQSKPTIKQLSKDEIKRLGC